jgi:hypothetical protein
MDRVRRLDRSSFGRAQRLDNGMIRAPARLTRTGVFTYLTADGKTVRELRLPEEVFAPESLSSFELVPLTNDHPTENGGEVTAENAKRLSVGTVGNVKRDETDRNYVGAVLMIHDADAASLVESGKREISCGYFCDREPAEPGATYRDPLTGDAEPYDFVQRNIRGNHVAIVNVGRAGPEVRIIMDAADGVQVDSTDVRVMKTQTEGVTPERKATEMLKITIDGVTYEVAPQVSEALAKERKINADMLEAVRGESAKVKSDLDKAIARADALEAEKKTLAEKLEKATKPEAISAAVTERVSLESIAARFEVKTDGLDNLAVRRAVITKIDANVKLEGKSDDYVIGMFDHVTKTDANTAVSKLKGEPSSVVKVDEKTLKNAADRRAEFNNAFFGKSAK